ncbi:peptide chain release factor N(5)-glutamine methyltransferase [Salegentibacter sp. F188]|uniref:Release factor glutamine methyltransferase n=1 Tax=Autumnicola patrickiae TaxID=3075591 RepID=A0ABU3DX39_9FLAO|nr:peptide chain release factor N(5)-glutamine methyltransferase [Salegentibacter sp. F188]MDT0688294.1 peptide chain release factor N(5)-glutamine methyltransferase [Salegentibacter sp. F188]
MKIQNTKYLKSLQLKALKINFRKELEEEYPREEVDSFFNLLAEEYLGMSRLEMALQPDRQISEADNCHFEDAIKKLRNHQPIQYIIGTTEFFGLKFKVTEGVLIPRPETEELVQWILDEVSSEEKIKILDIGTGSGCIAISLAKKLPNAEVSAMDISGEVLKIAKMNAESNSVNVNFIQQDVLEVEELENFDIIVSNPPYVRELEKKDMQRNVLDYEPALALYVEDQNPLIFYEKITKLAKKALDQSGKLYFEINQYLAEETGSLLKNSGFEACLKKDIFGNYRMLRGKKE